MKKGAKKESEELMQKVTETAQKRAKICQNGRKMATEIGRKSRKSWKKRHPKIDAKIGCRKNALEFHTGSHFNRFLGRPGVRGLQISDYTGRLQSTIYTLAIPVGCGGPKGVKNL